MGRSTVHYADNETNNILKRLHNKLRPAGTPVERVEYIIELLLLRIFEAKIKQDELFSPLRKLFEEENYRLLFSHLLSLNGEQILSELNKNIFPFYSAILSKAREVINGNLPQKMQDQLVLMEEVFANSNFTNNVKGGVIAEVVGMVNEIDEKYILKTDLLGDAIESALSETGGTKDLGLYRTPDHIRRMMVEMVDPDFTDTIFDPACGTAGFLFDAYDYVIEKARITRQFPAENVANMFYRTGIGGIEYQGRIRKMAAVNMYIRGLNPHNIDQGDSLKLYDPSRDAGSKSVVIANPPFGAERDQPAYPNVWEEYSKESETTILFVKLMFDLLKQNGRCAVVVSEGFLTWGQGSACALRKLLLNEANLRAVISLPQGVFVSKSGQGAKTSILYFEKGHATDFVWYYKVENDGFSMGTNRKPIEGSQIPELLELFKQVKHGQHPQETRNNFCVSKEQIETLDPRIAERIRKEVSEKTEKKNAAKREKLVIDLDDKIGSEKISKEIYKEKLWQFNNIIEGQIDNEVAKVIERAHSFHFNLQNYRSVLNVEQVESWKKILRDVEVRKDERLENLYHELTLAESSGAMQILACLNPKDSLHMDIAKEYLGKQGKMVLEHVKPFTDLFEILKETRVFEFEPLSNFLIDLSNERKIEIEDDRIYLEPTISTKDNRMLVSEEALGASIKVKKRILIKPGDLVIGKMHTQNGSYAFADREYVSTGTFVPFRIEEARINPRYLFISLRLALMKLAVEDSTGRETYKTEEILALQIPVPPLEIQSEIVKRIERQEQIIEGAEKLKEAFRIFLDSNADVVKLRDIAENIGTGSTPSRSNPEYFNGSIHWVLTAEVNETEILDSTETVTEKAVKECGLKIYPPDTILMAMYGQGQTRGRTAITKIPAAITQNCAGIVIDQKKADPYYVWYYLQSIYELIRGQDYSGAGVPHLNLEIVKDLEIPLPDLDVQRHAVERINRQMQTLKGIHLFKVEAEQRIEKILAEVWGEAVSGR